MDTSYRSTKDIVDSIPTLLCWIWLSVVGGLLLIICNFFWLQHTMAVQTSHPSMEQRSTLRGVQRMSGLRTIHKAATQKIME